MTRSLRLERGPTDNGGGTRPSRLREMRRFMPSFLLVALLAGTATAQMPKAAPDRVEDLRTHIPVIFVAEDGMFPTDWLTPQINAKAVSLEDTQRQRSSDLLKKAMALYPVKLLKTELSRVYVCKKINFYGLDYGGTNSSDTVYLTNDTPAMGYTDRFFEGSFHHEFSSILLRNHSAFFDEKGWRGANPVGFKYGDGGISALRTGVDNTEIDGELAKTGLLTQYSEASVEEDFNMMVENLFTGGKRFWRLADTYEPLMKKATITIGFYGKLDPLFTEEYFRKLAGP